MTKEDQDLLDVDIPYRMTAISGMVWAADVIRAGPYANRFSVRLGEQVLLACQHPRFLTNPLLEAGAIYCRVMMEFLGIKVDGTGTKLIEATGRRGDDIGIERFDVPCVTLSDLDAASGSDPATIRRSCVITLHIGNKGIAHFTEAPTDNPVVNVIPCALVVLRLIEKHVYERLGIPTPDYRLWPKFTLPAPTQT